MTREFLLGTVFGIVISTGAVLSFFVGGYVMLEHLLDRTPNRHIEVLR
jgi:hypothetical protein